MSLPKVVFRIAKLKSFGNIGGAGAHNLRTRPTPNADPKKNNIVLAGPKSGEEIVSAVKQKLDGLTVRKNAVLAVEAVVSASPEYFRPDAPDRAGHWDAEKLASWRKVTEPWIKENFPHAVSVVLHLDEATPHYQIIDVPINDKTGKLDARSKYGGRETLAGWQTSAAKPVEHLGIERGIEGSRAKHTDLKEFYGHVNKEIAPLPPIQTPRPKPLPEPTFSEKLPFTDASEARKKKEQEIAKQTEQRQKEVDAKKAAALKNYPILDAKARNTVLAEKRADINAGLIDTLEKTVKSKDQIIAQNKAVANQLRALPIADVLVRLYGAELAEGSKESHASRKYKLADGQEVAVTQGTAGEVWIVQGGTGSKGAINLVMALDGIEYKDALKVLGGAFSPGAIVREHSRTLVQQAKKQVAAVLAEPVLAPPRDDRKWSKVKTWLQDVRAIPARLVDWLHDQKVAYADVRNNAVFPRSNGGAFMRGTTETTFHRSIGGKACGPYIIPGNPGSTQVVLCESAIDACSLKALHPAAKIIAVGGNLLSPDEISSHVSPGSTVLLGFDNDAQGQIFTRQAKQLWPDAEALQMPSGAKDWNEALQSGKIVPDASWSDPAGGGGSAPPAAAPASPQKFSFARPRA